MIPRIALLPEKKFIGKSLMMSFSQNRTGELWRSVMPFRNEIKNSLSSDLVSLQCYPPKFFENFDVTKQFQKWALIEVPDFEQIPAGIDKFQFEGGLYAVFIHRGSSNDNSTFEYIFSQWLPRSEYLLDDRPHFEVLGEKYKNNDVNSEEEIWIPVKAKAEFNPEAVLENFDRHASHLAERTANMNVFRSSGLTYVDSGIASDTFNVIHIRDSRKISSTELMKAITTFREKALPFCLWISEENLTERLSAMLSDFGLVRKQVPPEPGMILNLDRYEPIQDELHAQIYKVKSARDIENYSVVLASLATPPDANVVAYYKRVCNTILNDTHGVSYTIFVKEGKTIAGVEIFPTDHITAGIYGLATRPSERGKGIGTALMSYALNELKQRGFRRVVLQASEDGAGIYRRLGFQDVTAYYEFGQQ